MTAGTNDEDGAAGMRTLRRARTLVGLTLTVAVLPALAPTAPARAADPVSPFGERLYLVTLEGPGTAGLTDDAGASTRMRAAQDVVLSAVDDADPVYRWTTALNGMAVPLTRFEAQRMGATPGVARVEAAEVRPVAGSAAPATAAAASPPGKGGRGTVIGFVDTGLAPDSPVFADTPDLARVPSGFAGACEDADGWSADDCSRKIVAARHFLAGFGKESLSSSARQSAYDEVGHGTQVASVAAGNGGVSALSDDENLGRFSGVAPDAHIAVYKACWAAPDPDDDGCSTADVVTAVDRAVADGVDVLSLAVAGAPGLDTVDLALLGAAEADVSVVAAVGNDLPSPGHAQPWVTTVGGASGRMPAGELRTPDGRSFGGVMTADSVSGPARVVSAESIPAPGRSVEDARLCLPGSLDAARATGRLVLCDRGAVARVDKSAAVELADGAGMVLANTRRQDLAADLHAVPTLHVTRSTATDLRAALARGPVRGTLRQTTGAARPPRVLRASASGDPEAAAVKPDLVARASGLLAASSPAGTGSRWALTSGTSLATARVAGMAARLHTLHPRWSTARVRSALMTSAGGLSPATSALRQGAGLPDPGEARAPGLVLDQEPGAYRAALERDRLDLLNLPSVIAPVAGRPVTLTRQVTSTADRALYYSSSASGFDRHRVQVTPAAIRIAPGETRTFRIRVTGESAGDETDSGWVTWRGADGTRVRLPVVLR